MRLHCETYLPVDYGLVCTLLEQLAQSRTSTLGPDVLTAIRHYTQLLRRHVVAESEIAELCRRIYRKHQRALDLIYEHRPDRQAAIHDMLLGVIARQEGKIVPIASSKGYIRFVPVQWNTIPPLLTGTGWPPSTNLLETFSRFNLPTPRAVCASMSTSVRVISPRDSASSTLQCSTGLPSGHLQNRCTLCGAPFTRVASCHRGTMSQGMMC
jgi:hypothetical protein